MVVVFVCLFDFLLLLLFLLFCLFVVLCLFLFYFVLFFVLFCLFGFFFLFFVFCFGGKGYLIYAGIQINTMHIENTHAHTKIRE